jgi:hypothetical protein
MAIGTIEAWQKPQGRPDHAAVGRGPELASRYCKNILQCQGQSSIIRKLSHTSCVVYHSAVLYSAMRCAHLPRTTLNRVFPALCSACCASRLALTMTLAACTRTSRSMATCCVCCPAASQRSCCALQTPCAQCSHTSSGMHARSSTITQRVKAPHPQHPACKPYTTVFTQALVQGLVTSLQP